MKENPPLSGGTCCKKISKVAILLVQLRGPELFCERRNSATAVHSCNERKKTNKTTSVVMWANPSGRASHACSLYNRLDASAAESSLPLPSVSSREIYRSQDRRAYSLVCAEEENEEWYLGTPGSHKVDAPWFAIFFNIFFVFFAGFFFPDSRERDPPLVYRRRDLPFCVPHLLRSYFLAWVSGMCLRICSAWPQKLRLTRVPHASACCRKES